MNAEVLSLIVHDGALVAGGLFNQAGDSIVNGLAAWNGSEWLSLGGGALGFVNTMTLHDGDLIAGGGFGTTDFRVVRWDGVSWEILADDLDHYVRAMAVRQDTLIVGGSFSEIGSVEVNGIAGWIGE